MSGHEKIPRDIKKGRNTKKAPLLPGAGGDGVKPSWARCVGEHLVCSPCGEVAGRALWRRLACPEVLLSLLPLAKPYIIPPTRDFKRRAAVLVMVQYEN